MEAFLQNMFNFVFKFVTSFLFFSTLAARLGECSPSWIEPPPSKIIMTIEAAHTVGVLIMSCNNFVSNHLAEYDVDVKE